MYGSKIRNNCDPHNTDTYTPPNTYHFSLLPFVIEVYVIYILFTHAYIHIISCCWVQINIYKYVIVVNKHMYCSAAKHTF